MKKTTTSKKLIAFLFINCSIIEIYTMVVVAINLAFSSKSGYSVDFSPLIALIGAIVGEVIGYAVYSLKALKENSAGGIVYESAALNNFKQEEGDY